MRTFSLLALALAATGGFLRAEPLAEGSYVDLIVVPVGPVALAEFESDPGTPAVATNTPAGGKPSGNKPAPAPGGGSGVRVKQQDPSTLPPAAVFIRHGNSKVYQVPCSLNAVGSPVRTPIADSVVTLLQRDGATATSFKELGKFTVTQAGGRVLVVLSKPHKETRWDKPTVSSYPVPAKPAPQLVFVNGSQEMQCGVKVAAAVKALEPLKPLVWAGAPDPRGIDVSLAMRDAKGAFLAPFFQSNVELKANHTTFFIPYSVSAEESFRGGKYATASIDNETTRPATLIETGN